MKKIISIFLLLAMLAPLVACSGDEDKKDTPTTTAKPEDTTISDIYYEPDDLPENLDFGGEEVVFAVSGEIMFDNEIFVEELSSEIVNDSIYNRERYVEDRLGVEITRLETDDFSLEKQVAADEDVVQVFGEANYALTENIFSGYLLDLYTVEYLDFDKPWWPQYFIDAAEIYDSLYVAGGSISLSLYRNMFGIYYNKKIVEDYAATIPELADLYGLVNSGKWTIDKMTELGSTVYVDLNGNNERDVEDLYGVLYGAEIGIDNMWSCFDINVLSKTEDGWYEADVNVEKLYTAVEKMQQLLHNTTGCYMPDPENTSDESFLEEIPEKFASESAMFMMNKLYAAELDSVRNMQSDYGLLPFPKFDENQKEYLTHAHDHYQTLAIPVTNQNPDVTGAVLEAMASYSYRNTVPSYLDKALKGKYMNDPQSRQMVDLIVDGLKLDTCWVYVYTLGNAFAGEFRDIVGLNESNYASTATAGIKGLEKELKTYKRLYDIIINK